MYGLPLPTIGPVSEGHRPVSESLALVAGLGLGSRFAADVAGWDRPADWADVLLAHLVTVVSSIAGAPIVPELYPWPAAPGKAEVDPAEAARAHRELVARSAYRGPELVPVDEVEGADSGPGDVVEWPGANGGPGGSE